MLHRPIRSNGAAPRRILEGTLRIVMNDAEVHIHLTGMGSVATFTPCAGLGFGMRRNRASRIPGAAVQYALIEVS